MPSHCCEPPSDCCYPPRHPRPCCLPDPYCDLYSILCKLDALEARNERRYRDLEKKLDDICRKIDEIDVDSEPIPPALRTIIENIPPTLNCIADTQSGIWDGVSSVVDTLRLPLPTGGDDFVPPPPEMPSYPSSCNPVAVKQRKQRANASKNV
uniref:Uncharacterized protein n=1 Tax=viral metagenome TaxID=1070528 RepID=A0A6C0BZW1_9ZZZZ